MGLAGLKGLRTKLDAVLMALDALPPGSSVDMAEAVKNAYLEGYWAAEGKHGNPTGREGELGLDDWAKSRARARLYD